MLYAFLNKFGDKITKKKLKEMDKTMTEIGKIIREEGIEEGVEKGQANRIFKGFRAFKQNSIYWNKIMNWSLKSYIIWI